ncbi:hypothetical protein NFI96_019373, partial [Prochilodus magdalenae]
SVVSRIFRVPSLCDGGVVLAWTVSVVSRIFRVPSLCDGGVVLAWTVSVVSRIFRVPSLCDGGVVLAWTVSVVSRIFRVPSLCDGGVVLAWTVSVVSRIFRVPSLCDGGVVLAWTVSVVSRIFRVPSLCDGGGGVTVRVVGAALSGLLLFRCSAGLMWRLSWCRSVRRCNNYKDEFYLGENCNQKWTTLTFALVASLPGVTLAVLVGVTVYVLVACRRPKGLSTQGRIGLWEGGVGVPPLRWSPAGLGQLSLAPAGGVVLTLRIPWDSFGGLPDSTYPSPGLGYPVTVLTVGLFYRGGNQMKSISAAEEDMFPGMVFASDLNAHPSGGPKGLSSGPRPPQGGTANPYSPSASMRTTADRPPMGGPRPLSSTYESIPPPSARGGGSFDRPGAGGAQQPYSYAAGPGQVISNPYAKTTNPYEEISPDQYNPPSQGFSD